MQQHDRALLKLPELVLFSVQLLKLCMSQDPVLTCTGETVKCTSDLVPSGAEQDVQFSPHCLFKCLPVNLPV
ncbi:hypothetical protein FQA47_023287 [Oryzias melastigma]|uniref:Kazal-like domain-containing protein n=1 Tax=Oryzias melastigma TaxID=30732 RepID=A0A834CAD9_ORYME|nr:hypothetical protein FQA47_023287 [Oryzias melastigma]